MSFDNNLKTLRLLKKVSRRQLAADMGISYSALAKYELGERHPDHDLLLRFSKYFDVTVDYLLGNTNIYLENLDMMKDKKSAYDNVTASNTFSGINIEYLQLALEMQEANLDPSSIRKIIEALVMQKER